MNNGSTASTTATTATTATTTTVSTAAAMAASGAETTPTSSSGQAFARSVTTAATERQRDPAVIAEAGAESSPSTSTVASRTVVETPLRSKRPGEPVDTQGASKKMALAETESERLAHRSARTLPKATATSRQLDQCGPLIEGVGNTFGCLYSLFQLSFPQPVQSLLVQNPQLLTNQHPQARAILDQAKNTLEVPGNSLNNAGIFLQNLGEHGLTAKEAQEAERASQSSEDCSNQIVELVDKAIKDFQEEQSQDNKELLLAVQLVGNNKKNVMEQRTLVLYPLKDWVYASFSALDNKALNSISAMGGVFPSLGQLPNLVDYPLFKMPKAELASKLKPVLDIAADQFKNGFAGIQKLVLTPLEYDSAHPQSEQASGSATV